MTDPKKDTGVQEDNKEANTASERPAQQDGNKDKGNWDVHQRVDEEGNELSPDDIK